MILPSACDFIGVTLPSELEEIYIKNPSCTFWDDSFAYTEDEEGNPNYTVTGIIGEYFKNHEELVSLELPSTIESIPTAPFEGCTSECDHCRRKSGLFIRRNRQYLQ